jgi:hypothetical protein
MLIGGYEIPRRVLALIGALLLVAVIAVVLLVVKPFSSSSSSPTQPVGTVIGPQTGTGATAVKGTKLTITLSNPAGILKGYAAFVALAKGNGHQPQWTQRLAGKALVAPVAKDVYTLSVTFSPCKTNCAIAQGGGVGLAPYNFSVHGNTKVVVVAHCRKVKYAPKIDCGTSTIKSS